MYHLWFFQLKGLNKKETEAQIVDLLKMVDLEDKRFQFSARLSGGMKRKLHVAISLIGHSKVIIASYPV